MREFSKNDSKGITLIALVVTIVVLLILAGVAISMLTGENGIINQALQAKEQNEIAEEKEKLELAAQASKTKTEWGEITEENLTAELDTNIGSGKYNLDKDVKLYVVTYTESKRSYYIDENGKVGEVVEREGLKVGDYINYIPDENTEGYSADKLGEEITGSTSNETITQDKQYAEDGEGMTWQILRIYADGSMDLIGSATSQLVYFQGANGYNNGVTVMNDICETLYSRENIKARSVNYEDLESWLTDEGKKVRDGYSSYSGGPTYGHTQTYITNRYYPSLYAQEIGAKIDSGLSGLTEGIDKEQGNTTGLGISEEGIAIGSIQASSSLTVTQTFWSEEMISNNFGEGYKALKTTNTYWLASRYVNCYLSNIGFGFQRTNSSLIQGYDIFYAGGSIYGEGFSLRAIVSMKSNVQIEKCIGDNSINNMHTITQY